jgi:hypothetical protein
MNRIKGLYIILISLVSLPATAQEVVTGLSSNSRLTSKTGSQIRAVKAITDTLELPFFDDFAYPGPYPDTSLWSDNFVFINNTFTANQLTMGVATFDLLDPMGRLYEDAVTFGFKADVLTSMPLNLALQPSDNVWFSFLYQPGGLGDLPESGDSLTLQFFSPLTDSWTSVWKKEGTSFHEFRPVLIPITEDQYLRKGFRFRFTAYGSLALGTEDPALKTSGDNWHIDYVLLDKNRHEKDTVMHDVAFTLPVRSLLRNHEAMPLKHFREIYLSEMGSEISVNYRNNDTVVRNVTRQFEIRNLTSGVLVHNFTGGATNTPPLTNITYNAPLFYTFSTTGPDTAHYEVKSYLITDIFDPKSNDTIIYNQVFGNHFIVDDGSAEAGYGITGQGSRNSMVAYRYRAYAPDSLRAIQICFNDSYLNANQRSFDIAVWDNNNGIPGNLLYTGEELMVELGTGHGGFHTYILSDPVYIDDVFYIGWKQRSETFLNAGLDLNSSNNGRQFYWLNGAWYQSQVGGSLMIRAVTGPKIPSTGIGDVRAAIPTLKIWPNPVRNILNTDVNDHLTGTITFNVTDLSGRVVLSASGVNSIDVSLLRPGIYLLLTSRNGVLTARNRFIKIY